MASLDELYVYGGRPPVPGRLAAVPGRSTPDSRSKVDLVTKLGPDRVSRDGSTIINGATVTFQAIDTVLDPYHALAVNSCVARGSAVTVTIQ